VAAADDKSPMTVAFPPAKTGTSFRRLLQQKASPMDHLTGSIALIRHPTHLENQWLSYWNIARRYYDFVIAERLDSESFRESLDREVAWVLDIRRGKDYVISRQARLHLDFPIDSEADHMFAEVEFYIVDLYGKSGRASVELNKQLCWLDSEEVLSGKASDAQCVNPELVKLLNNADVIARHSR